MVACVALKWRTRPVFAAGCVLLVALIATALMRAQVAPPPQNIAPGTQPDGTTLLPNGWRLGPIGKHLSLSTLPLNIALANDGRYAVVSNDGIVKPTLSVIDLSTWTVKNTTTVDGAWLGLAFHPDGTKLY